MNKHKYLPNNFKCLLFKNVLSHKNYKMKKIIWLFVACFTISLTSCFDVVETITLKENGSGNYEIKMDLGGAFEMVNSLKGMMGESSSKTSKKKDFEKIDSSFSFEKEVMESKELTAEEKAIFKNGKGYMKMNEEKGEGVIVLNFPFAKTADFEVIQKVMNSSRREHVGFNKIGMALGKEAQQLSEKKPTTEGGIVGDFKYVLTNNSFARTVKEKKETKAAEDEDAENMAQMAMMKQFMGMMEIKSTLIINLPSPAKNVNGKNITVSEDKKRIEFSKKFPIDKKPTPFDFDMNIEF